MTTKNVTGDCCGNSREPTLGIRVYPRRYVAILIQNYRNSLISTDHKGRRAALRLEDHPPAGLPIHHYDQRFSEAQVPHAVGFLNFGLGGEPFPVDKALACIGVHREVSDLECREVLEEMTSL